MKGHKPETNSSKLKIKKAPTGIAGFDQITGGGVPRGRTSLICGGAGSCKTLFAMEFLLNGATEFDEPGVCITFEETADELGVNLASLGYDIPKLLKTKKLVMDYVSVERRQFEETGEYDLEALFIRIGHAIKSIKAKRVVLDTIEVLFSGLQNTAIVRAELRRLFGWLKQQGVTALVTAESGNGALTRFGLEEYVADCVVLLDHRVNEQVSTRRIRVVKYRGSMHGTNEYPFLVHSQGISVFPITSVGLSHKASTQRLTTGVEGLDGMLGGLGFYRGSSILISGTAGTGKSSFAAHFVNAACERGERALYFAFEESPDQIIRNMRSIGLDLEPQIKRGLLNIIAARPTSIGLEAHLAAMNNHIEETSPSVVVMDPITNLISVGDVTSVKAMLTRMIDFLKMRQITALFTNLSVDGVVEQTAVGISSLMDAWMLLLDKEIGAERRRMLYVLKARGMPHSTESREFSLTDRGIMVSGHIPARKPEARASFGRTRS